MRLKVAHQNLLVLVLASVQQHLDSALMLICILSCFEYLQYNMRVIPEADMVVRIVGTSNKFIDECLGVS